MGPYSRASFVTLVRVAETGVAFRTPTRLEMLEGDDARVVAALWDALPGDVPALARAAGVEETEARDTLDALVDAGFARRGEPIGPAAVLAERAGAEAASSVAGARIALSGTGPLADAVAGALSGWGAIVARGEPRGDERLFVATGGPGSGARFAAANARAIATGVPAIFVEWRGLLGLVGPTVRAGATACWRCAELRAWGNAASPEALVAERAAGESGDALPPAHAAVLAGVAACEAARVLATGAGALEDGILEVDLWSLATTRAPALRVPGCDACG